MPQWHALRGQLLAPRHELSARAMSPRAMSGSTERDLADERVATEHCGLLPAVTVSRHADSPVAMITGAASGIGRATGQLLQSAGWTVVGLDLHPSPFEHTKIVNVAHRAAFTEAVDAVEADVGSVELLVTAAGYDQEVAFADLTVDAWDQMFAVVFGGLVHGCAAVLPHMKRRRRGSVVAVSSEIGLAGCAHYTHYSAAKGAVNAFVKALALEAIEYGVHVNAVAPGPTDTPMVENSQWCDPEYVRTLPLMRLVTAEEIAGTVALLADPEAYYVGEILSPNAGAVI